MARRVYDDWQRLVEAVLRREQMLEMFRAPPSRTPSISSVASDSSSSSSSDHPFPDLSFNDSVSQVSLRDIVIRDEKFESRKHVQEEILATLLNDDVHTIGIFGTGGIGKTTMAKRIGEMVKKEKIFDEVIMTVVGRLPDIEKVQSDIAEALGLKLREKSWQVRASLLRNTMNDLSNILIILDDVWASLVWEDVGIPYCSGEKRIKIMFTSQNQDVLEAMQVQKDFLVQALSDDEAWSLFKEKAGDKADDSVLQLIAKVLMEECKGLPLVLDILGLALKGKDGRFWVDALLELKRCACSDISQSQVPHHVYRPLKLSYTWLSDEAKSLFMLCCLFKEDSDIFLEDLVRFGMGLNIFDGIMSLEEARNRMCELTRVLKDHSLLEDGCDPVNVKMHDVVRNVAFSIASEDNQTYIVSQDARLINMEEKEKYTRISLISTAPIDLSEELICPNLQFLRLQSNLNEDLTEGKPLVMPDNFFYGMRKLNVLVISGIYIESLPPSLHLITQLRTLHLHSCSVKNISVVGQLANLEILSCYNCPRIEVLPAEVGRLNRLRLLELYHCQHLKTVAPGVISSLILLEELKMRGSFVQWQSSGQQEKTNAALAELHSLSHLVNLEIEIEDPEVMTTAIHPFPHVTKFYIKVGTEDKTSHYIEAPQPYKIREGQRCMQLSLPDESIPGNWIHRLLRSTEDLSLIGNGSSNLLLEELEKVKKLRCCHCSKMSHLLNSTNEGICQVLESLELEDLTNLQEVCHGLLPAGSFLNLRNIKLYALPSLLQLWKSPIPDSPLVNLKSVDIRNCKVLQYLFPLTTGNFVQLEELRILFCGKMKEVLLNDLHETTSSITFPRLKKLILNSLPSLVAFSSGIESMKFPQLHFLRIRNLPVLKGLLPGNSQLHVFFNQGVEFDMLKELSLHGLDDNISQIWSLRIPMGHFLKLEKLQICACNKLKNLFSPSIAGALVRLKELDIKDSLMMAEVIVNVGQETERRLFPRLERIDLWRLRC